MWLVSQREANTGGVLEEFFSAQSPEPPAGAKFRYASVAVGLVELSARGNSRSAALEAKKQYLKALQAVNESLADPVQARDDCLLLAIYTLTTYETISGEGLKSFQAWSAHVQATAALLQRRDTEQVESDGVRFFGQLHQARRRYVINYYAAG